MESIPVSAIIKVIPVKKEDLENNCTEFIKKIYTAILKYDDLWTNEKSNKLRRIDE